MAFPFRITLLLGFFLVQAPFAHACRCSSIPTIEQAFVDAGLVAKIKVLSTERNSLVDKSSGIKVTAVVMELFKGEVLWGSQIEFYTYTATEKCGYEINVGNELLIYPTESKGKLLIEACARICFQNGDESECEDLHTLRTLRSGEVVVKYHLGTEWKADSIVVRKAENELVVWAVPKSEKGYSLTSGHQLKGRVLLDLRTQNQQGIDYRLSISYQLAEPLKDKADAENVLMALFGLESNRGLAALGNEALPLNWKIHDFSRGDDPTPQAVQIAESLDQITIWKEK